MSEAPVFDSVLITATTPSRRVSADEFFELPLSTRIQYIIARTATFYLAGREVDRVKALAELRRARADAVGSPA